MGVRISGQWGDGNWYPGVIDGQFGRVWHVKFDDGDQAYLAPARIRAGGTGSKSARAAGCVAVLIVLIVAAAIVIAVVAGTTDDEEYSEPPASGPAAVPAAPAAPAQLAPLLPLTAPPALGTRVLAPFESGRFYFVGTVAAVNGAQVDVVFLDGDRRSVPAGTLMQDNVGPGTPVTARSARGDGWYSGVVRSRNADIVEVAFTGGGVETVSLSRVRLRAQP